LASLAQSQHLKNSWLQETVELNIIVCHLNGLKLQLGYFKKIKHSLLGGLTMLGPSLHLIELRNCSLYSQILDEDVKRDKSISRDVHCPKGVV